MFRLIVAGALLLTAVPAAWAAPSPGFSKADCDAPAFRAYILARLGHGKYLESGQQSLQRFNYGPITQATTVSNTGTTISCEITVDLDTPKGTRPVHGRFTATQSPNGPSSWRWQPGN